MLSQVDYKILFPPKWKVTVEFEMKSGATKEQVEDMVDTIMLDAVADFNDFFTADCRVYGEPRSSCEHCEIEEPYTRYSELRAKQSKVTKKRKGV